MSHVRLCTALTTAQSHICGKPGRSRFSLGKFCQPGVQWSASIVRSTCPFELVSCVTVSPGMDKFPAKAADSPSSSSDA